MCNTNPKVTLLRSKQYSRLWNIFPPSAKTLLPHFLVYFKVTSYPIVTGRFSRDTYFCSINKMQKISEKMRYHRLKAELSHNEVEKISGISKRTIYRYENDLVKEENMRVNVLKKLAQLYHLDKYAFCTDYHIFIDNNPGIQLKEYRKRNGLSQKDLAHYLGINKGIVQHWEQGINKPPKEIWRQLFINSPD